MKNKKNMTLAVSQKKLAKTVRHCTVLIALGALSVSAHAQSTSKLFGWLIRGSATNTQPPSGTDMVSIPHVGHDGVNPGGVLQSVYQTLYTNQHTAGSHIGIMLQNDTGPLDGAKDPDALNAATTFLTSQGYKLDYVFGDLENIGTFVTADENVSEMVAQVRSNPDPNISSARIGQYGYFPGENDVSQWKPENGPRGSADLRYRTSGLDVAMPHCYPYASFLNHTNTSVWKNGAPLSPNNRSAFFYAPLERFSTAKRALPAGHELIPWIADYWHQDGYNPGQQNVPTPADNAALLKHFRLRGADGFYALEVNQIQTLVQTWYYQTYGTDPDPGKAKLAASQAYYKDMHDAWHTLDTFYALPGVSRILNLATNKTTGVEWSAAQKGDRVYTLISNLNGASQSVNWADYPHLPLQSPTLATGTHGDFHYRTAYLDNDNMSAYDSTHDMSSQGSLSWSGINPGNFSVTTPPGGGNTSGKAVVSGSGSATSEAWYKTRGAGFAATDKVVYSAWLYRHNGAVSFLPVNTTGTSSSAQPAASAQGPSLTIDGTQFKLRKSLDSGTTYTAVNLNASADKWYEVQIAVDPGTGGSGGSDYGTASAWVRNVSDGQKEFTRLVFDDPTTSGVVERLKTIALQLNTTAARSTTDFNGWQLSTSGAGNAIDNLNAGYYVPHMGDNFEHYDVAATDMSSESDWLSSASSWRVRAPYSTSGNNSARALTPVAGSYSVSGAWHTENPKFSPTDIVAYQGKLYSGNSSAAQPVGFAPYRNSTANTGPYAMLYWNEIRLRSIVPNGTVYKANGITVAPNAWYELRVVVDPNRDIDGTVGGDYGVAKLYVRNVTANESFQQVTLDDISTTAVETETEIPLQLNVYRNTTVLDGWYVYGYGENSQIDDLRAFVVE